MASVHDQISEQFWAFENRGRGWHVFNEPVSPEPPFEPFNGYKIAEVPDDGLRPTVLSALVISVTNWFSPSTSSTRPSASEPEPLGMVREDDVIEFQACLPSDLRIKSEALEAFCLNLKGC